MHRLMTYGAKCRNPHAEKYAELARNSSKCGSKHFVYSNAFDNRMPGPRHHMRQSDVPWRDCFTTQKWRWILHDFRMFGLWKAIKIHYYMGESWRRKDEKIFVGKDENGNKYWMSRRTTGSMFTRIIMPPDMHWFRGQSNHAPPPIWMKWMQGNTAHTPAQIKARGEWGLNSRVGIPMPFNVKYEENGPLTAGETYSRDPMWISAPGLLANPERRALEEAGYSRWVPNKGMPVYMPFSGVHDYSDELVEEYYRGQWAFGRASKGNDHDEWKA